MSLAWCGTDAARHACERWHYSGCLPIDAGLVKVGVWEHGVFVGCLVFGRGPSPVLCRRYGLEPTQVAELARVALDRHQTPVSRLIAIAVRMLRRHAPGLKLLVSFADPQQGHVGTIYQAAGWTYAGVSRPETQYLVQGRWVHRRYLKSTTLFGKPNPIRDAGAVPTRSVPGKHRYLLPLDPAVKATVDRLALPYPKRP